MPGTGGVDVMEESLSFREVVRRRYAATASSRSSTGRSVKREFVHAKKRIGGCGDAEPDGGQRRRTPRPARRARRATPRSGTSGGRRARRSPAARRAAARRAPRRSRRGRGAPTATASTASTPSSGTTNTPTAVARQHPHVDEQHRDAPRRRPTPMRERPPPRVAQSRPEGADRAEPAVAVLAEGAERRRDAGRAQRRGERQQRPREHRVGRDEQHDERQARDQQQEVRRSGRGTASR